MALLCSSGTPGAMTTMHGMHGGDLPWKLQTLPYFERG